MVFYLNVAQVIISISLVILILLQQSGGGLSPIFGGEGGLYRTRRGIERTIFIATIVLTALFLGTAIMQSILASY